jgi:hypothetical protein
MVSCLWLAQPWRTAALLAQICFYLLAVVDPLIPNGLRVKRLTAVVKAFVVLVAAAGCALTVFIVPAQRLWKETRVSVATDS